MVPEVGGKQRRFADTTDRRRSQRQSAVGKTGFQARFVAVSILVHSKCVSSQIKECKSQGSSKSPDFSDDAGSSRSDTATTIMHDVSVEEWSDKTGHVKEIWFGEMPDSTKIETAGFGQDDFCKNWGDFAGSDQTPYEVDYAAGGQMRECLEGEIGANTSLRCAGATNISSSFWQAR